MAGRDTDDAIVETIEIAAPPARVFRALTDPRELAAWWGDERMYACDRWELDLRVGGRWRATGHSVRGGTFKVEGEFLEIEPPRVLSYSWKPDWVEAPATVIRIALEPIASGTRLIWTQTGFSGHPRALADQRGGLPGVLGWLRGFVERAETVASRR